MTVRPARSVLIEHVGRWWLGHERGWTLRVPAAEGVADVEYVVAYDWGLGKRIPVVPPERDACGSLHHHHADNAGARRGFPPGTATEGAAHVSADNRLRAEQLAALAPGDPVVIESAGDFRRPRH